MNDKLIYPVWITLAILLTALNAYLFVDLNKMIKAENKRNQHEVEYMKIDKHWHEMNAKMKESVE